MGRCQLQRKITAKLLYNKKTEIEKKKQKAEAHKKKLNVLKLRLSL